MTGPVKWEGTYLTLERDGEFIYFNNQELTVRVRDLLNGETR